MLTVIVGTPLDFEPRVNILGKLPLELSLKVLEELHPVDVLAVARTNRHFQRYLRDEQNGHVWKTSRRIHVKCDIPDPILMSEYAMASLLFDRGECLMCGNRTLGQIHVWSYAFGERVCGNTSCRMKLESTFVKPPDRHADLICSLVPFAHSCSFFDYGRFGKCSGRHGETNPRANHRVCKKGDVESILAGLSTGLTQAQLGMKYKLSPETCDLYTSFIRQPSACSKLVQTMNSLPDSLRAAHPQERGQEYFKEKRGCLYDWLLSTKFERNLPCDYVLNTIVEWSDPDDLYRVRKICRIRDIFLGELYQEWLCDQYDRI